MSEKFNLLNLIFSVEDYQDTHWLIRVFSIIKVKFPKREYAEKKKKNPYLKYKKDKFDITKLPAATGQVRDIQLANFELLKEMDYVCKKNNLQYWLDFGSLLGAFRHKGFIPWDDDIDTGMVRSDYEKFIEIFNRDTRNSDFYAEYFVGITNNCFVKIRHKKCELLFVDIFPYDNCPSLTEAEQIKISEKMRKYRINYEKGNFSREELRNKLAFCKKEYVDNIPGEKTSLIYGADFNHEYLNWVFPYDMVFPLKETMFEGVSLPVMNKSEEYLTRTFGNYMEYPKRFGMGHSMYLNLSEEDKKLISELINKE